MFHTRVAEVCEKKAMESRSSVQGFEGPKDVSVSGDHVESVAGEDIRKRHRLTCGALHVRATLSAVYQCYLFEIHDCFDKTSQLPAINFREPFMVA